MASAAPALTCVICLEEGAKCSAPRLVCGHTVCPPCLDKYLATAAPAAARIGAGVRCPGLCLPDKAVPGFDARCPAFLPNHLVRPALAAAAAQGADPAPLHVRLRHQAEEAASEATIQQTTRRCPSCGVPSTLVSGCNSVVCPLCSRPWCYGCGTPVHPCLRQRCRLQYIPWAPPPLPPPRLPWAPPPPPPNLGWGHTIAMWLERNRDAIGISIVLVFAPPCMMVATAIAAFKALVIMVQVAIMSAVLSLSAVIAACVGAVVFLPVSIAAVVSFFIFAHAFVSNCLKQCVRR